MLMGRRRSYRVQNCLTVTSPSKEHILNGLKPPDAEEDGAKRFSLQPFKGFIYTALCSVFIILSSTFVKKLTYIDSGELSMVRNLFVLVGALPIAVYYSDNVLGPKKYRWILAGRGLLGASALYLNLLAFRLLPLAEASIILATVPALVSVTARIFLKEPFGVVQGGAILMTVGGMLLSVRLPRLLQMQGQEGGDDYFKGLGAALGCVLILSFTFVALRKMQDVHFSVILLHMGVFGTAENAMLTGLLSSFSLPRCGWDQVQVILIGVFGLFGHLFLTLAIQAEAVGIVSVVKSSLDIVFAMAAQVVFFDLSPDVYNAGGALLVMASVSAIGLRKWISTLPQEHPHRKRLKFLLI